MNSGCTSAAATLGCVHAQEPVRVTYRNLYKWPESDAEFVKSVTRGGAGTGVGWCEKRQNQKRRGPRRPLQQPRVVDSYSCRQMYLRSYTFSKKESLPEKTKKCLGRVKEGVSTAAAHAASVPGCVPLCINGGARKNRDEYMFGMAGAARQASKKRCPGVRKLRDASSAAFYFIFHRLLSCTASIDVVDH